MGAQRWRVLHGLPVTEMFEIAGTSKVNQCVQLWSSLRLPFEPKGEALLARSGLRAALEGLRGSPDHLLDAIFTSLERDQSDLENLLLYNVGPSAFRPSGVRSVRLRRFFAAPCLSPSGSWYEHHYRYMLRPRVAALPDDASMIASFDTDSMQPSSLGDAWSVWHGLKRGQVKLFEPIEESVRLGLRISVETPSPTVSPFSIIKPVIDGVVTALHCHDGSAIDLIAGRLAPRLLLPEAEVVRMLLNDSAALLGKRRLVWPLRDGLQLNPADDRLDEVSFEVRGASLDSVVAGILYRAGDSQGRLAKGI